MISTMFIHFDGPRNIEGLEIAADGNCLSWNKDGEDISIFLPSPEAAAEIRDVMIKHIWNDKLELKDAS